MRYWDASALAPAIVTEDGSELVDEWLRSDDSVCTWGLTRVELVSAIERRAREGILNAPRRRTALKLVADVCAAATEVLDRRLADAAARERFDVLT